MNTELEDYIIDHISPEPPILTELYRLTHTSIINPNMVSGHLQGSLLGMLTSMIRPKRVLEIGTYTGYSAIAIALCLDKEAILDTIEIDDELRHISNEFIERAGLSGMIRQHTGNALEIIPSLNTTYDMVFIDGDKREYCDYLSVVKPLLPTGGFIIADNVLWDGKVADLRNSDPMTSGIRNFNSMVAGDPELEKVILPVRDGLTLIRKLA